MGRTKGTYTLTSNIEPKVGAPLDARTIVKLLADLTASNTFEYPYKGMKVFVEENNKSYTLVGSDPTISSNWTEDGSGGSHTIKNPAGTAMTQRSNLQFVDLTVSDDSINDVTKVENIHVIQSESELDNLPDGLYMLDEDEDTVIDGNLVGYDNTDSGLDAENVQDAIDEVVEALDDKVDISAKGVANGVAELDSTGKVPSSQLPSFVDDVIEVADYDHLPATGETGKIYVALDTNKTYRWGGTEYVEISESLALGETSSTAYRGDRGKIAYDHSQLTSGNPHNVTKSDIGLGNVDNTSDSTKKTNFTGSIASGNTGFTTGGDVYTALGGKADKVSSATNGNLAGLNASGNLTDSGWNGAKDTTSISGNPISISGLKANQLAKNPIIMLEPIQDLHGQSKPYPAGGGKNKLPMTVQSIKDVNTSGTWSGNVYTLNNVTFTILTDSADNVIGINVNSSRGASSTTAFFVTKNYTNANSLILNGCPSGGATNTYRLDAGTDATSDIGSGKSISGGLSDVNIRIVIFSGVTMSNKVFYPMIRLATETDSSFAPYENICPISGYDKIEVLSCGKNLFDDELELGTLDNQGQPVNSTTAMRASHFVIVKPNTAYYIKITTTTTLNMFAYDASGAFIERIFNGSGDQAFTTPANAKYIRFNLSSTYGTTNKKDICINEGNTAITYVPYDKTTDLSESLGQTVYWGRLNVRTGEFEVLGTIYDLGDLNYVYTSGIFLTTSISSLKKSGADSLYTASCYEYVSNGGLGIEDYKIADSSTSSYAGALIIHDSRYTDAPTFKTAIAGQKIVYKLATPFEIQLTPHEISLLKDYAYLSTNGTNISLDYHNGELASLGDVSQLGETVNELGEFWENSDSWQILSATQLGTAGATLYAHGAMRILTINESPTGASEGLVLTLPEGHRPHNTSGGVCLIQDGSNWRTGMVSALRGGKVTTVVFNPNTSTLSYANNMTLYRAEIIYMVDTP